jgi:tetratricopeptide (TPR) repeat protein
MEATQASASPSVGQHPQFRAGVTPVSGPVGAAAAAGYVPGAEGGMSFPRGQEAGRASGPGDRGHDEQDPTRPLDPRRLGQGAPSTGRHDGVSDPDDPTRPFGLRRRAASEGLGQVEEATRAIDPRGLASPVPGMPGHRHDDVHRPEAGSRPEAESRPEMGSRPVAGHGLEAGHGPEFGQRPEAGPVSGTGQHSGGWQAAASTPVQPGERTVEQGFAGGWASGPQGGQGTSAGSGPVQPVESGLAQPFASETTGAPVAGGPAASGPASDEPETHGLGWLLSLSGLGATTPVPEAEPAAPVEDIEPETRPLGWFAPVETETGDDVQTETDSAEAESAATDGSTPPESAAQDVPVRDVPATAATTLAQELPATAATHPDQELPATAATHPEQELPATAATHPEQELPATAATHPEQELPATTATHPDQELPATTATHPDQELPATAATHPEQELPATTATHPDQELPATTATHPDQELPATTATHPDQELPVADATDLDEEPPEAVPTDLNQDVRATAATDLNQDVAAAAATDLNQGVPATAATDLAQDVPPAAATAAPPLAQAVPTPPGFTPAGNAAGPAATIPDATPIPDGTAIPDATATPGAVEPGAEASTAAGGRSVSGGEIGLTTGGGRPAGEGTASGYTGDVGTFVPHPRQSSGDRLDTGDAFSGSEADSGLDAARASATRNSDVPDGFVGTEAGTGEASADVTVAAGGEPERSGAADRSGFGAEAPEGGPTSFDTAASSGLDTGLASGGTGVPGFSWAAAGGNSAGVTAGASAPVEESSSFGDGGSVADQEEAGRHGGPGGSALRGGVSDDGEDLTSVVEGLRVGKPDDAADSVPAHPETGDPTETDDSAEAAPATAGGSVEATGQVGAGSDEESDLTRTLQIVRVKSAVAQPAPSHDTGSVDGDPAAEHDEATATASDVITEVSSVVAADVGLPSGTAAPIEDAVEPDTVFFDGEPQTVVIAEEPATVLLDAEPDTVSISEEPETAPLIVEPDTVLLSTDEETTVLGAEPDTVTLNAEPDTAALHPEPETVALHTEPETAALHTEPETVTIHTEPETVTIHTEPETVTIHPEPETVTIHPEPETVTIHPEAETGAIQAEPQTGALQVEPDSVTLPTEPDTAIFSVEPETVAFDSGREAVAVDVEPDTAVLNVETAAVAVDTEPETAALNPETETVSVDEEPETAALSLDTETVTVDVEPERVALSTEPETVAVAAAPETAMEPGAVSVAGDDVVDVPTGSEIVGEAAGAAAPGVTTVAGEVGPDPVSAGGDATGEGSADGAPGVPLQGVTSETGSGSAAEASAEVASRPVPLEAETEAGAETETGAEAETGAETAESVRIEPVRQRRDQRAPADRRRADPEQILAAYPWAYDPQTLREQVDEPDRLWDVADRLTDRLEFAERDNVRAGLLSLRAVVYRIVGELDDALADGREGLRHAEASGELRTAAIAQARLAHVLQWRGEFEEADRLYAEADSPELPPRTRAEIGELAGRSAYEQGRYLEAVNHFERALDVRRGEDPELVERVELALDAISRRSGAAGWGPYPRARDEILGLPAAPVPLLDDGAGLWGYAAAVEPRFAEAQPFAEGAAWVRRPESAAWELIDPQGELIIASAHGYLGVTRFAEGLAWVTRQDQGGWFAIDRENRLVVPAGGFEDARPFRRGLAVVRQGGVWGAVDRHGRFAVTPRYQRFVTALHVGGTVDGFTDEGLAVVDAGDRFGVVDRAGRLVVEPVHAAVVIHPVAFLVRNAAGLWGALDRSGKPMVDMGHRDRDSVVEALPEETRPVL